MIRWKREIGEYFFGTETFSNIRSSRSILEKIYDQMREDSINMGLNNLTNAGASLFIGKWLPNALLYASLVMMSRIYSPDIRDMLIDTSMSILTAVLGETYRFVISKEQANFREKLSRNRENDLEILAELGEDFEEENWRY